MNNEQLAMPARNHPYRPTAVRSLFTAHSTLAEIYSFSAKERDAETGLRVTSLRSVSSSSLNQTRTSSVWYSLVRRFGSRYYSSDLSIWLSVDPMSDKYPSFSPYTYCANNPVKCVDPNGEDYEVVMDEDSKSITIKASYYCLGSDCSEENKQKLQTALEYWNNCEDFSFITKDSKQTYSIKFELSLSDKPIGDACNSFQVQPDLGMDSDGRKIRGEVSVGKSIIISEDAMKQPNLRTLKQEIGHTLGMKDGNVFQNNIYGENLMTQGAIKDNVEKFSIRQSLQKFYGNYSQCGTTYSIGKCTNSINQKWHGKIIKNKKK